MRLFDTHAHLDGFAAEGTVEAVLARAQAAGVARICAVGSSEASNECVVRLAQAHPDILLAAVGYDRDQVEKRPRLDRLAALAQEPCVVAVGEIGLDYYYSTETAPAQRTLFSKMLAFALERQRPVIVHSREADDDTIAMLKEFSIAWKKSFHTVEKSGPGFPQHGKNQPPVSTAWKKVFHGVEHPPPPGILHCFTGNAAFADQLLDLGLMISFSGIVSFNNAGPLREVAQEIPEDRLLIETDCPYLTPAPFRGKVNEPAYVRRVAEVLAEARGVEATALAEATFANAQRVFQWEGNR
ncbi:MAG: TatD family hydrolase [Kiritimatiellae bacterium]|jgi:TatD DNase family protein|nr:TatD family hydrolase [Kiritimatiellia bacterium]MDY0149724.1 TatD family hydrolase [Kiritimatiellia bacterium]